jgi:predicted ribosomally synthesized peptide with nif11-like leader
MSEEQLKAFLEAVKADAGLQEKLKAAGDADAVVAIAKAAGFVISAEELKRAQVEVSEEELEGVAGGKVAGNVFLETAGTAGLGCSIVGGNGGNGGAG